MKENLMDMQLKITELMANKSSLEQENLMLRQKIVELEKEVENTRTLINVELMEDDIKKLILKNFARNKSSLSMKVNNSNDALISTLVSSINEPFICLEVRKLQSQKRRLKTKYKSKFTNTFTMF